MSPFVLKFSQMILHTETSKLMYNWSFLFEVLHKPTLLPSTFNALSLHTYFDHRCMKTFGPNCISVKICVFSHQILESIFRFFMYPIKLPTRKSKFYKWFQRLKQKCRNCLHVSENIQHLVLVSLLKHNLTLAKDAFWILAIAYSRYRSISIFYFEVPGCAGRVTSVSVVQCMHIHRLINYEC